jgi:hypothetical protein
MTKRSNAERPQAPLPGAWLAAVDRAGYRYWSPCPPAGSGSRPNTHGANTTSRPSGSRYVTPPLAAQYGCCSTAGVAGRTQASSCRGDGLCVVQVQHERIEVRSRWRRLGCAHDLERPGQPPAEAPITASAPKRSPAVSLTTHRCTARHGSNVLGHDHHHNADGDNPAAGDDVETSISKAVRWAPWSGSDSCSAPTAAVAAP